MTNNYNIAHDVSTVLKLEYQSGDVNEIQINCANGAKIMAKLFFMILMKYQKFRHTNTYWDSSLSIFE